MRVAWLPHAIDDLKRLREFLRLQNAEAARRAVATIGKTVTILIDNPHFGKIVDEIADFRDVIIPFGRRSYILRYRIDGQVIVIVALRHAREGGFFDP